jgi:hypothetical protein
MKKIVITLCTAFVAFLVLSAFVARTTMSGIHGTVTPADGAKKVWAINGTDSASTVPAGGNFSLDVKPGTWKVLVEANAPYKNATVESVVVEEGKSADAGEIKLGQ